jgi:hypothetical protein
MRPDPLHIWWGALAFCTGMALVLAMLSVGQAIELSIVGHSSGQGLQNLSFYGDALNVSILQNGSWQGWNVTLEAMA